MRALLLMFLAVAAGCGPAGDLATEPAPTAVTEPPAPSEAPAPSEVSASTAPGAEAPQEEEAEEEAQEEAAAEERGDEATGAPEDPAEPPSDLALKPSAERRSAGRKTSSRGSGRRGVRAPANEPAVDEDPLPLDALPEEAIVFNAPAEVLIDSVTQVRLLIQPGLDGGALEAAFEAERGELQTGAVSTEQVKTSDEMGASLVSSGLSVTPMRPERQLLSRREPTEWLWEVRAQEGGRHTLTLTLYAIPPGRSSGRTLRVMEREMQVHVPPTQQAAAAFQDHWEWMWTFLLAPLGGWWLTRKRRREEEPPPAE